MKPDAYIRLYRGDWLRDTMHLDATAMGAYLLLVLHHRGRPGITTNDSELRTICRVGLQDWARVKGLLSGFFRETDGLWVNNRSVEEWTNDMADYEAACRRTAEAHKARRRNAQRNVARNEERNNEGNSPLDNKESESESIDGGTGGTASNPTSTLSKNETELPVGFPKTETEASAASGFVGCPPEFAVKVWSKAMSRNGKDAKGIPISQWRYYLRTEWTYEQERAAKQQEPGRVQGNGAQVIVWQKELERVTVRMATIRSTYGGHQTWAQGDVEQFNRLKTRKHELQQKLGVMV